MVPAVPLAVPDREALLAEQLGPEGVRREVHGARLPDQVDDRERQRHEDRGDPPPVDAAPPPVRAVRARRGAPRGGCRADLAGRAARRRRDGGEHGPEHGCRRLAARATARNAAVRSTSSGRSSQLQCPPSTQLELRLAAERVGVRLPEAARGCRGRRSATAGAPGSAARRAARPRGQHLGRRRAVELQDRSLRAVVEAAPGRVRQLGGSSRRKAQRVAKPIISSPSERSPPGARDSVPAVAGQERHGAEHHQPLHALGQALRERQPHHTPVVHHERERARARWAHRTPRGSGRSPRSSSRTRPAWPSGRSPAGRAPRRRSARGTAPSRMTPSGRRGRTGSGASPASRQRTSSPPLRPPLDDLHGRVLQP